MSNYAIGFNYNGEDYLRMASRVERKVAVDDSYAVFSHQMTVQTEETGEAAKAGRAYFGMARDDGNYHDLRLELADVVITARVTAELLGFDLEAAVVEKLDIILDRGGL